MKKYISVVLALALVLCLSPPVFEAGSSGLTTELHFKYTPAEPSYFIDANVEKLTGNQNRLTITVMEYMPDGSVRATTETFMIPNNSEGTYEVGGYSVFVDVKGNIQIRRIDVVSIAPDAYIAPGTPVLVNAAATADDFISISYPLPWKEFSV